VSKLILSTTMTVDGVISVADWYVSEGGGELARNLLAAGLIDELRFWIHPVVWGPGERPFESEEQARLSLVGSETFDSGVTLLRYQPV
jgi:dihydrofolate reductase